jgi:hypothetical protein
MYSQIKHAIGFAFIGFCMSASVYSQTFTLVGTQTFASPNVSTSIVTPFNFSRHDKNERFCFDAPSREPFASSSLKITQRSVENADESYCYISGENFVELFAEINEPRRICMNIYVKSRGGLGMSGNNGKISCTMQYATYKPETPLYSGPHGPGELKLSTPNIPVEIEAAEEGRSFVKVKFPYRAIEGMISKAIEESAKNTTQDLSVKVHKQGFINNTKDKGIFSYYIDIDASYVKNGLDFGMRCEVFARFSIINSKVKQVRLTDQGSAADCKSGSYIAEIYNIEQQVQNLIVGKFKSSIEQTLDEKMPLLQFLAEEDPKLKLFFDDAWIYGNTCTWRNEDALCIGLSWPDRLAFASRKRNLLQSPNPISTPVDQNKLAQDISYFEDWALQEGYFKSADGKFNYPAAFKGYGTPNQALEDFDSVLFAGLMCSSGITAGCDAVKQSISSEGRPFRSPRRVGDTDKVDESTFSGDHLKGLLLYWDTTGDISSFVNFLSYVKTQLTYVPNDSYRVDYGYSTCTQRAPNFTCFVGSDWALIRLLAQKYGVSQNLPPDIDQLIKRYEVDSGDSEFESYISVAGYRLHLVVVSELIKYRIKPTEANIHVFKIAASREPENPFFAFLAFGKTAHVQSKTDAQCPRDKARSSRTDWAWQRADHRMAWQDGMVWDCLYLYRMLR